MAEVESLGYQAAWLPGAQGGDLFGAAENLLRATTAMTIATGVLNVWRHTAEETAERCSQFRSTYGDRFMLGLGSSHASLIQPNPAEQPFRPLAKTSEFLDGLDHAAEPVNADRRILAAHGPKMLQLARERTSGVHPSLVTPDYVNTLRSNVGPDKLIVVEQPVVLDSNPDSARAIARAHLRRHLPLAVYQASFTRMGFAEEDLVDDGSDRLIDGLVAWGDENAILKRITAHHHAGADQVCINALSFDRLEHPIGQWRALAPVLNS